MFLQRICLIKMGFWRHFHLNWWDTAASEFRSLHKRLRQEQGEGLLVLCRSLSDYFFYLNSWCFVCIFVVIKEHIFFYLNSWSFVCIFVVINEHNFFNLNSLCFVCVVLVIKEHLFFVLGVGSLCGYTKARAREHCQFLGSCKFVCIFP